jgi:hypothetical protein
VNRQLILLAALTIGVGSRSLAAQAPDSSIELTVKSGAPLRVALDERVTVKRIGQPVAGTLAEPVYAYDRIVLPAGVRVRGHIDAFEEAPRVARVRSMLGGSFTSLRHVVVRFDTIVMDDGRQIPIQTVVTGTPARMRRQVAGGPRKADAEQGGGIVARASERAREEVARAREEIVQRKDEAIAALKAPGKLNRLKEAAIDRLPYHPQFLGKGTVYNAELVSPIAMGTVPAAPLAAAGTMPAPKSILNARLVTPLDSAKTPRGTPMKAVVTEPVFSGDHQLILPEGTVLTGEVTSAKTARRFRRNGQLRFLFESVQPPDQASHSLLASLHSVQVGADDHVAVDDEGGTKVTNPKSRFIAPTLAILALNRTADSGERRFDHDADDTAGAAAQSGNVGSRSVGGFLGLGLIGTALSQMSRPVAIAMGVVGVARTVYSSVLARGQEVSFPADTPIQVQLAPGPPPAK